MAIDFKSIWKDNEAGFLDLLSVVSVYDETTVTEGMPCGKGINDALCFMKKRCQEAGFEIKEFDGHAFSASIGKGERIDIVSHLDVVEPGNDWTSDPFTPVNTQSYIRARGSQDMKSGAWLSFLALKTLKEQNIELNKTFTLVYGTDEERTMDDMRYYVSKAGYPAFAFTPDGQFPITAGEKGALMWICRSAYCGSLIYLKGGVQPNVISPYAECEIKGNYVSLVLEKISEYNYDGCCRLEVENTFISINGKAGHASRPEHGENASIYLLRILNDIVDDRYLKEIYDTFYDAYGKGADISDGDRLTLNLGIINIADGSTEMFIDCRYPYGTGSDYLSEKLKIKLKDFTVELPYDDEPTYVEDSDPYVKALKKAYEDVTHEECTSMISGGVSYSKVFKHSVAFGCVSANSLMMAHQKDETILKSDLYQALEIYYRSLINFLEI